MPALTREQLLSGAAIVLYAGSFLAMIWMYAHDTARESSPDVNIYAWLVLILVVPLSAGFAIGRYWAMALIVFLFVSLGVVSELEPVRRETFEVEGGPTLFALITAVVHAPLLLIGAWIRKRLWPRRAARKWFSPTA